MCFEAERGERDLHACWEHLMWVTFLCHFIMGTQLQQIPGNLIPEINVEELKQQYLSSICPVLQTFSSEAGQSLPDLEQGCQYKNSCSQS